MQIKMIHITRHLFLITFLIIALDCIGQTTRSKGDIVVLERDTVIKNKLMKLDLSKFKGLTVETLLQNDTIKMYKNYWWTDEPPGKLRSLNLTFARGLFLEIYPVRKEGRAVQFSETMTFDFEGFKKLRISELIIEKDFFEEQVIKMTSEKAKIN